MTTETDDSGVFMDVLEQIADGEVADKLGQKLREVVQAVQQTGKVGKVTLTLKVAKQGSAAVCAADIKVTKPEDASPHTVFFFGPDGSLITENPRQMKIREVAERPFDPKEYKKISEHHGPVRMVAEQVDRRAEERSRGLAKIEEARREAAKPEPAPADALDADEGIDDDDDDDGEV